MTEPNLTTRAQALAVINALPLQELRGWISARLHGDDMGLSMDVRQDERPYTLIEEVYPDLDRHIREDVSNIVAEFVHVMAINPQSLWNGEAAHELLLLAQSVCTDQLIDDLFEMAETEGFFSADEQERGNDLHYRVLQTLLALGWRGRPAFWQRQVALSPDRYIGVAFNALLPAHLQDAIDLLAHVPWTTEVENRVLRSLPYWVEKYSQAGIVDLLARALQQMDPVAQNAIKSNLERHNITLPHHAPRSFDYTRSRQFLASRGYRPEPTKLRLGSKELERAA